MIVSGGYSKALNSYLDTTLIFANGSWRSLGARLPYAVQNLAMVTLNNQVFLFGNISFSRQERAENIFSGGYAKNDGYQSQVLRYNTATSSWEGAGTMKEKRWGHAVAVIQDVGRFC